MDNFLFYILKSTLCFSVLYITFRILMSKETCFSLNRWILLSIIFVSLLIPKAYFSHLHVPVQVELIPEFSSNHIQLESRSVADYSNTTQDSAQTENSKDGQSIALISIITYIYITGLLIAFLVLIKNIITILLLRYRSTVIKMDGFKVIISEQDIHSFAFANIIIISKRDFDINGVTILSHEKAHIRLKHFYDLIFLELVKVFHWFNPAIYGVIRSIKEIHEFQADAEVLYSGVDASNYQLLLIEKCVGPKRFAFANSFNHCQIKNRITMMNNQKISKAWRWKVATFLPILALLLMSFSKKSAEIIETASFNANSENKQINSFSDVPQVNSNKLTEQVIHIKSDGTYIGNKKCSLEEIVKTGKEWNNVGNDWILLQIDEAVDKKQVDEVREGLHNANVYFIVESITGYDELVYFAGDVSSMAKFKNGKWNDWLGSELFKILGDKYDSVEYRIYYFFIIDDNGKVREGHVTKPCNYPEINAAYNKVLAQIPDWYPAKRLGKTVSVYNREIRSQVATKK